MRRDLLKPLFRPEEPTDHPKSLQGGFRYPVLIDPSFGVTGNLAQGRYRPSATLLPSGNVLIAGGSNGGLLVGACLALLAQRVPEAHELAAVPVIVHEMGQWCVYPNFDEIKKYTGPLKPKNFEIFRDSLAAHGMLDQWRDFLRASGKLQALCYKEEGCLVQALTELELVLVDLEQWQIGRHTLFHRDPV